MIKAAVVIVAAGRGTRMGPGVDKLFIELAGRPVIAHTWQRLDACPSVERVILVVRPEMEDAFRALANAIGCTKPWQLTHGGAERQDSVWNGLEALPAGAEIVAIHDGARPCVTDKLVQATNLAAHLHGAAVAAQSVTDTIKSSTDGSTVDRHLDRSTLWAVQTPQTFRVDVIRRALQEVRTRNLKVTDDTAACELIGQTVRLVPCSTPNPKVTTPADVPYVEMLLRSRPCDKC